MEFIFVLQLLKRKLKPKNNKICIIRYLLLYIYYGSETSTNTYYTNIAIFIVFSFWFLENKHNALLIIFIKIINKKWSFGSCMNNYKMM